jgi:hypothetical protein
MSRMISVTSFSRTVNTTNRIAPGPISPSALKRSSASSWAMSLRERIHGSSNTSFAVSKRMPCLRKFSRFFAGSQSNRHIWPCAFYSDGCTYNCQYFAQLMPQMQVARRSGVGGPLALVAMGGLVQGEVGVERGVFGGVAYVDYEFAGVDGPFFMCFVPVAEGAGVEG